MNIVCGSHLANIFKTSKYFRQNLGLVATVDKNGSRQYNQKDRFSFFYNTLYRTTIHAQGNIGNIKVYIDYYIRDNIIAFYYSENFEEFLFNYDDSLYKTKGMDFYLGHLIKLVEEEYELKKKKEELKKLEEKPRGNPLKVISNPGQVLYEDLKAYLDEKRKNRI
jgi:hypothetical protein